MSGVKWIKITTDIFSDEKMVLIESLPEADSIIVIWFKLLALAGHTNNSGVFLLTESIAYDENMLAAVFRRDVEMVKLALDTFEKFGMIERVDGVITIPNWGKHQSIDQLESKREYMRNYMQEYREKQKKTACKTNVKVNSKLLHKTNVSPLDIDIDKDIEIDKEKEINKYSGSEEPKNARKIQKHKFGEYNNVFLTDEEYEKLNAEFADLNFRIENLSSYIASTGKSYKSHYATIKNWARMEKEKANKKPVNKKAQELDDFYNMAAQWAESEEP